MRILPSAPTWSAWAAGTVRLYARRPWSTRERRASRSATQPAEQSSVDSDIDYRALVEQVPAITYIAGVGETAEWEFISPQVHPILGFTPEEFTSQLWLEQLHPDDKDRLFREEQAAIRGGTECKRVLEYRMFARDGRVVWISDEFTLFRDSGNELFYRGVMLDVTERKEIEQAAALQQRRFRSLVQDTADVIAVLDATATIEYITPSVEKVLGFHPGEQVGTSSLALVHPQDLHSTRELLATIVNRPGTATRRELRLQHKGGTWRWIELTVTNLLHDPSVKGLVSNYRDITDRKNLEDQLRHRALHDPLTGLANRALLMDRLEQYLARSKRLNQRLAVLFIDLDGFKDINDTLGHAAGDNFLIQTAQRMRSCLRSNDTAARVGGDEFVVLLEDAAVVADTAATAERINELIGTPFTWHGKETCTQASIGIAFSGSGADAVEQLLHNADAAMYMAKASGKGRYEFHQPEDGMDRTKDYAVAKGR
ncbi:MAG: diguanylate cyclase [Actinomycetota bacterium]|nr:diguanylate cyclase [Actinomycetota bacterium]